MLWALMLDTILRCAFSTGKFPLWCQGSITWNPKLSVPGSVTTPSEFKTFSGSGQLLYSITTPPEHISEILSLVTVTQQLTEISIDKGVSSSSLSLNRSTPSYIVTDPDSAMDADFNYGRLCPLSYARSKGLILYPPLLYESSSVWHRVPCWGNPGTLWWTHRFLDLPASQHGSNGATAPAPKPPPSAIFLSTIPW